MSRPLTIAILGASGTVGPLLLQALSIHLNSTEVCIRILARPQSVERINTLAEQYASLSLAVHINNYTSTGSETELNAPLNGVDVVISAVGDDSGLTSKDSSNTLDFSLGLLGETLSQKRRRSLG
jgi:aspartate-semialdehyde dehydrogenase